MKNGVPKFGTPVGTGMNQEGRSWMKMINRVWMLFLSAVLSAGAVGCGCMESPAEKKIVAEMEEKYGEEFRFVEWRTLNFGSASCVIPSRGS